MISLEDCIAFSGLSEDEVAAIGEHEHIPQVAACALADYLLKQPHGGEAIRAMIVDDIHQALCAGRIRHAQELFMALRHFLEGHPAARIGVEFLNSSNCRRLVCSPRVPFWRLADMLVVIRLISWWRLMRRSNEMCDVRSRIKRTVWGISGENSFCSDGNCSRRRRALRMHDKEVGARRTPRLRTLHCGL